MRIEPYSAGGDCHKSSVRAGGLGRGVVYSGMRRTGRGVFIIVRALFYRLDGRLGDDWWVRFAIFIFGRRVWKIRGRRPFWFNEVGSLLWLGVLGGRGHFS